MTAVGRRPAVILALVALTGQACSTGGNSSSSTVLTPTPEPTSATGPVDNGSAVTAERIVFRPGEFSAFLSGAAELGEGATYVLGAAEGQSLILTLSSVEDNAVYDLFSPSGAPLATEQTEGAIAVREGGDHQIVVGGTGGNATYDLEVSIYPAERVRFVHGAIGTTVSGAVVPGERAAHVLGALAGSSCRRREGDSRGPRPQQMSATERGFSSFSAFLAHENSPVVSSVAKTR